DASRGPRFVVERSGRPAKAATVLPARLDVAADPASRRAGDRLWLASYVFPRPGDYVVRFERGDAGDGEAVASRSLTVLPSERRQRARRRRSNVTDVVAPAVAPPAARPAAPETAPAPAKPAPPPPQPDDGIDWTVPIDATSAPPLPEPWVDSR
ncbi:MAG: hypothetical protein KC543_07455, partial [Myxococcales bacterium]|nr:hypothetical protein [Myxococcales bacterium]